MELNGTVFGLAGIAGVGAFAYLCRIFNSADNESTAPATPIKESAEYVAGEPMPPGLTLEEQKVALKVLSGLWRDGELKKVQFGDLSKIWRPETKTVEEKKRQVNFTRPEITKFYLDRVRGRPFFNGDALEAVLDLLELLDAEGHCGSVVRQNEKEAERNYDVDTYNTLGKVPLYRHSINVAIAAMEKVATPSVVPKAVIAALAHDLGKIPRYYGKHYKSITHPMVGMSIAEAMPSVKGIKWWDEISAAIRNHHGQSTEYLDALIREADQAARRFEMGNASQQEEDGLIPETSAVGVAVPAQQKAAPSEKLAPNTPAAPSPPVAPVTEEPQETAPAEAPPGQVVTSPPQKVPEPQPERQKVVPLPFIPPATEDQEQPERKRVQRQLKDISAWFDPEKFVKEMARIINTTQTGDKFWSALALGSYVYVKPVGFYGLVVRHSKHDPNVVTAGASEQDRDDYLYSVIMELKKVKDLVATEFLGSDRFGAVFIHNPGPDGSGTKQFLIPFRADFFGEEISRAESRRNTLMKKTVALVPAFKKGGN